MKKVAKYLSRFVQRQIKLRHARKRAKELLPLCEQVTGIKLEGRLKLEATSAFKLFYRRVFDSLTASNDQERAEPVGFELAFMLGSICDLFVKKAHGYFDPQRVLIGINMSNYDPGSVSSDYTITHEIIHLLMSQLGASQPVNDDLTLCEGASCILWIPRYKVGSS